MRFHPFLATTVGLLLTVPAFAQSPVDLSLQFQPGKANLNAGQGGARATAACDDFNRANSTNMGADWTEIIGDYQVLNNECSTTSGGLDYMVHNSATDNYDTSVIEFDLNPNLGGGYAYNAAMIGYNSVNGESIFVKVQNQSGLPGYSNFGFYHANNGSGYNGWGGFGTLPYQITGGHVRVSVDGAGDNVNLDIDEDYDGVYEIQLDAPGLIASGLPGLLGTGAAHGTWSAGTFDNWSFNGGCSGPPGPALSVSGLVAGGVVTISVDHCTPGGLVRHGYSLYGGGPTVTPFGDLLLSPPFTELPAISVGAAGSGQLQAPVPPGTTGISVWLHALDLASLTFTNGVATNIG